MIIDLLVYEGAGPEEYKVFYANAGEHGELPKTFLDLDASHRRRDLEPSH